MLRMPGPEVNISGRLVSDPALHDARTFRGRSILQSGEAKQNPMMPNLGALSAFDFRRRGPLAPGLRLRACE
jgi:hypothetical protein